jgi:phosphopantothenoylcysteine decarboxylase/phosphopantothenate--cysteine ligase
MKILLGVSGGIAAYKAAELTRELQRRGAEVQVAMTAAAERFVTALTFAALSGRPVLTSLWTPTTGEVADGRADEFDIEHIRIAQEIDALVIAPATANLIARMAHGMADDLLTTLALATKAPIFLAPAMNVNMWQNPATQANIELLRSRGVQVLAPASGALACGMVGAGRLLEPLAIADAVLASLEQHTRRNDLAGETVVVTAGGTREAIDPVRYIGNRSSGRMGLALAEAAHARGAEVILITAAGGALTLGFATIEVNTAAEMQAAVLGHLARASVVLMAAAVADYRAAEPAAQKMKKGAALTLTLTRNDDILSRVVAERRPGTVVVGFAAETEHLLEEGRRKLREKGVDAIFANDVSQADSGFGVDRNAGVLLTAEDEVTLPSSSKRVLADRLLDHVVTMRRERHSCA